MASIHQVRRGVPKDGWHEHPHQPGRVRAQNRKLIDLKKIKFYPLCIEHLAVIGAHLRNECQILLLSLLWMPGVACPTERAHRGALLTLFSCKYPDSPITSC